MSSLDHDHPLQEGSAPRQRTGRTLPPAGGTRSRVRAGIPTPRQGDSAPDGAPSATRRGPARGTTVRTRAATAADVARTAGARAAAAAKAAKASPATAAATKAARTVAAKAATTAAAKASAAKSAATAKAASAKAKPTTAKPATAKPATAKPTTAKPATAKAATAKATTPKPAQAKPAASKAPAGKPSTAKAAGAKAAPAKRAAAKATPKPATTEPAAVAEPAAPARRPRPTPRPRSTAADPQVVRDADPAELVAAGEAQSRAVVEELTESPAGTDVVVVKELEPADATEPQGWRRRGIARLRRRPALTIAAVVISALGVGAVSVGTTAEAETAEQPSHSMSVAAELGISAQEPAAAPDAHDADQLAELAASRATREAQQTAAAQAQQQADAFAAEAIAEAQRPKAVFPIVGARLTSSFGPRWGTNHNGLDLAAPMLTPEYAAADGVVLQAGPASGFGQAVYIQHENGDVTVYGHMEEILVRAGQVVKAGDEIARVGSRGQSTGPHLHFEVRAGGLTGAPIDPVQWLAERGVRMP